MRRINTNEVKKEKRKHSRLAIDLDRQTATFNGEALSLTGAEFEMLVLLHNSMGTPVSREDCCQTLRGLEHDFNDRSIDMRISGLRKKIHDDQMPYKVITTVRNKGYMLLNG